MAQIDHEVIITADEGLSEDGQSEVESIASSSTSVTSSMLDYRFENGRTYHRYKDGKYNIPNDEREMDRLDLQHHICLMTLGGSLGLAPPCQPGAKVGRVLDIGTGTGIWAMQFGDDHPEAEVLGVDLSAIQPEFTGPNVKFEIDDLEEEWEYSRPFDYIHSRFMTSSIANWKDLLTQSFNNLSPGGFMELQEPDLLAQSDDGSLPSDCALNKYCKLLGEAMVKLGREYVSVPALKKLMEEVGFVDVTLSCYKWPMNTWPKDQKFKELGAYNYENISQAAEALAMAPLTRAFNWSCEEVNVFLIDVRKDLKNRNYHAYFPVYFVVGRKPEKKQQKETFVAA